MIAQSNIILISLEKYLELEVIHKCIIKIILINLIFISKYTVLYTYFK